MSYRRKDKLIACINGYNDISTIQMTVHSIEPFVDEIIAVLGAYATFPHIDPISNDGTEQIIKRYGGKILENRLFKNQMEKRQYYIDYLETDDYMLIIDGDEILRNGYYLNFIGKHSYYSIEAFSNRWLFDFEASKHSLVWKRTVTRIIKKTPKLRYFKRHNILLNDELQDVQDSEFALTIPKSMCHYLHFNQLRTHERIEKRTQYYHTTRHTQQKLYGKIGETYLDYQKRVGNMTINSNHLNSCLPICKPMGLDKQCINFDNGYCLAERKLI